MIAVADTVAALAPDQWSIVCVVLAVAVFAIGFLLAVKL